MIHNVDGFPGREITLQGEKFLYFGGTAYLGLQTDTSFQDIFIKNIKKYGTNYGASRNANIRLSIYENAENYLVNFIKSEDCLTLSSGFLTGQMLAKYFHLKSKNCFYAPGTHEALHLLGSENHSDYKNLIYDLNKVLEDNNVNPILFLDSIALDGKNYPDFGWMNKIELNRITLVIDDSHGFGIVGENGSGVYQLLKAMKPKELVVCGSLGKGFGIQAGFIASSNKIIKELRLANMYAAASPASPASMATLIESHEIITTKRNLLLENIAYFISNIAEKTLFKSSPDYPNFSFEDADLATFLLQHNIITTSFNYPTENDKLVQRIVLSAQHTRSDINRLTTTINEFISSVI